MTRGDLPKENTSRKMFYRKLCPYLSVANVELFIVVNNYRKYKTEQLYSKLSNFISRIQSNIYMALYLVLLTSVIIGSLIGRGSADRNIIVRPIASSACQTGSTRAEKYTACTEDCKKAPHSGEVKYGFCNFKTCVCVFIEFTS
ncbi:uncharacterized protein LOC111627495 [Centruroides sculpturatus]|uniref:uncharacterized protein LOC111627495 n=1 Tax=Centruroides sculpturatus TaxID=218467 RepID=UPI000C6DE710|nr:uncharacterized protein LOC111627495 [Centruroides sculpturatus]